MPTYAKDSKYVTKFMVAGARHSTLTDTKAQGEAWELQARAALALGKPVPPPAGKAAQRLGGAGSGTLAHVLRSAETLHWKTLRGSSRSVQNAASFVEWAGPDLDAAAAFTPAGIRAYIQYLIEERRVGNSTLNRYMSALSILIKHADLDKRPELPWFKEVKGRVRFFSVEEEHAVVALLTQWGRDAERDLFLFLLDTGLRPWAECCKAKWSDVSASKIAVYGKSGEWRDVPLTSRARAILARRPRDQAGPFTNLGAGTADLLWSRVRSQMPALAGTVWYTCRHTFASRLVQQGVSLKAVSVLMGNSAMIVDRVYAHLAPDHLAGAVDMLESFGGGNSRDNFRDNSGTNVPI